jgi:hypothetical protein
MTDYSLCRQTLPTDKLLPRKPEKTIPSKARPLPLRQTPPIKPESVSKDRIIPITTPPKSQTNPVKPDSHLKAHQASKGRLLPKNREKHPKGLAVWLMTGLD